MQLNNNATAVSTVLANALNRVTDDSKYILTESLLKIPR